VCLGACPERIISFPAYSVTSVGAMIKAIEVPDEDEEKPCVLAMTCENDALPLLDELALARKQLSPYVRFIPLRCAGSTNLVWIADALSKGIDGILVLGCKHGDDYQCHFIKGSQLCETRLTNIQDTLERLVLEKERVQFVPVAMNDSAALAKVLDDFMETIEDVGPNPYKGF
jgi:quinone-modifying oxidoreductase subunit QmoB